MISELRVRQALASSIYFDPCFPLSSPISSLSLTSSATFHLRGLLPASLSSQGSRVPRAKRRCGHWVVFHKVRSQVEVGLGSWFDPETRALIQVFHSGRAFLSLRARVYFINRRQAPKPRGRLSRAILSSTSRKNAVETKSV